MSHVRSRDGTAIAYDRQGAGPALIVVDGAMSTRLGPSKPELMALLARHFSVCCYDRRGRGDSGNTLPYGVEREVEDLEALIDAIGGPAFVVGHSSGACLAFEAALRLGPRIPRVAAYEAPYNDDPAAQRAWGAYVRDLDHALAEGRRGDALALFLGYVGTPPEQIAEMRRAPFWAGMEALAPTLAYDHSALMGPTGAVPRERLAAITVPVLALCGGASYPFMCETARTISQVVPHGTFRMLDGQRHDVEPGALAPALIAFFQS